MSWLKSPHVASATLQDLVRSLSILAYQSYYDRILSASADIIMAINVDLWALTPPDIPRKTSLMTILNNFPYKVCRKLGPSINNFSQSAGGSNAIIMTKRVFIDQQKE